MAIKSPFENEPLPEDNGAEIVSFSALTDPYPTLGSRVKIEATIRGLGYDRPLGLEFWADTPDNTSISIDKMPTDPVPAGETLRYTAEFTPKHEGIYTLHVYLFAGTRHIDAAADELSIGR
jgi:hypothetical protein